MTDITELTSVQKNANIHRLSRLIAYAPNDELRQMAVEVELYTDRLIEALEKAQGMEAYWKTQCRGITDHCEELQARIAELESRTITVKLPDYADNGIGETWDDGFNSGIDSTCDAFRSALTAAGIKVEAE
ncbi:hypothetical protein LOF14_00650 [Klebsiella variicola subsp. variicola]|nr:hypothetical protein LOF14_00650 [Klebsiella variicola subsp. variicola]